MKKRDHVDLYLPQVKEVLLEQILEVWLAMQGAELSKSNIKGHNQQTIEGFLTKRA